MTGVIAIGFSGYLRGFKVGYRVFYGFLGWICECGVTER